uniref:Uncharacterized protein n=1 Tax=Avena sativa TaxID=4498 RepID=A0ACD5XEP5_AVESA
MFGTCTIPFSLYMLIAQVQENWRNRMEMTPSHSRPLEGYCQQVNICTKIALSCMETDRHKRPSIVHIIDKLNDTETVIDEAVSWSESMRSWMHGDLVNVQAFPRSEAIPCAQRCKGFPVLVQVTGAQWHGEEEMPRPGVDLVVLVDLDMTIALQGGLSIVKQALMVVIDKLGTKDRLSIVSYEENAPHSMELTYMSEQGRNAARLMVNELAGNHGNDIIVGEGAKILRGREDEEGDSRVGCIMFLLDSSDMSVYDNYHEEFSSEFATYTFGLGDKHSPSLLKFVADMTGGTYSIVHYHINEMKNAFELLLSGLTKIAATSVKIKLRAHERVAISSIYSGGHDSRVSPDKVSGEINIKDIYTRERKNFIVYLTVPNGNNNNMKLLTVSGQYKSFIAGRRLPHMDVFVLRPGSTCLPEELAIHREVAAELVRMQLRNDVLYMNTNQPYQVNLIWNRIKSSEEGRGAPEETLLELGNQVDEIGRSLMYCSAYRLSWLTCHKWQRGTTIWASPVLTFTTPEQHEDGKEEQDNPTDY